MGSVSGHKPAGMSTKEYVRKDYHFENESFKSEVLMDALVNRREYYALVKATPKKAEGKPVYYVAMALVNHYPRSDYNVCVKNMGESMGPYYFNCPLSILDAADAAGEPSSEAAKEWRAKCRAVAAKRKDAGKLVPGAKVKFKNAMVFGNNLFTEDTFSVEGSGRKLRFRAAKNGVLCRVTNWKDREFEVLAA